MFFDTQKKSKKYNIIIIPERGNRTQKISLHSIFIKGVLAIFLVAGIGTLLFIYKFSNRYEALSVEAKTAKSKNEYIRTLEKDNENQNKQIKSYKAYKDTINNKMKEINELEQDIKDKLDKSDLLKNGNSFEEMHAEDQTSIETIDNKIQSLTVINEQLDKLLEKEKYIPSVMPVEGRITSYFGTRDNPFDLGGEENHPAIDIATAYGTEIHATAKGRVVYAEYKTGYGNCVYIDHGNGLTSLYGHASELLVKQGQVIEKGQVIALVGSTGRSTGPHVHFELRKNEEPINPIKIFQ